MSVIDVIIPVLNEQASIGKVITDIPKQVVRNIVVSDNGSTDDSRAVAAEAGAQVVEEPQKGYGKACLTGLAHIAKQETAPDIVVFMDGDYSDDPKELPDVVQPIIDGKADMVIGSRVVGEHEAGSLTAPQRFGNWLATWLMSIIYKVNYSDLGPFRAIRYQALLKLDMRDENFGWTVEMQIKAAKQGLNAIEVPVSYRNRIGTSKISGTVKGSVSAGYIILKTIFKYA